MSPFIRGAMVLSVMAGLAGCGTAPPCTVTYILTVTPQNGVADHTSAPPGNEVHYQGTVQAVPSRPSCPVPALIPVYPEYATWMNPDPADIQISSAKDPSNGTAVCLAATKGAVTLTGTFPQGAAGSVEKTVTLTCR